MRKSLWVVLALLAVLTSPRVSYARDIDYLQSFGSGLQTLRGETTNDQVTPERDFIESYEPREVVLSAPPTREYDEDSTPVDYVNGTVDAFNSVSWPEGTVEGRTFSLLGSVQRLLGAGGAQGLFSALFIVPAVGLVFLWWGVRKAKSIIWTAFRTGRLNLGTSVKRAYYRHKAKEWYG